MTKLKIRRSLPVFAVAILVLVLAVTACEHTEAPMVSEGPCLGQESPEAVMATLIEAYETRNIDLYAPLLHPEFAFRFPEYWTEPSFLREFYTWDADRDSAATAGLFNSASVTDIIINVTYGAAEFAAEIDLYGTMKIRVSTMHIVVIETDGTLCLVEEDFQDFFFARGEGEESDCWYLLEWRNLPSPWSWEPPDAGVHAGAMERLSWGMLKARYEQAFLDGRVGDEVQ